ncbi:MAG: M56 family metallopeptidase, partial [Pirellula sp.]
MIDKAIVWVVLENAVWVALLAIVVESVTRWTKSYRLANLLWLLVLIKFFIPPMVHLDLPLPINQLSISQQAPPHAEGERIPPKFELQFATALANSNSVIAESTDGQESSSNASLHGVTDNRTKDVDTNKFVAVTAWSKMFHGLGRMSFYSWILVGWTCISCVWFALLAIRLWRFHRQLAGLLITEESTNEVLTTVARKVGMGGAATVRTVDVQMSPIVTVGLRSTRIILPTKFLQTTSRDGLIATIAHELAHVRRGDHWVQRFALFAIGIFWWHPAAWFAVKRLRQSQDICCDMDVLIWFPKLSIPYAEALVEAAALTQRVSPAFALAFSDQHSLRSRIECVLRREATPQWSKVRVACLMGIGSLLACLSLRAVTMATSNENVTETVAEHTQDTKQTNAKQSVTRFFTAPVQAEIEVIETDGNRATNVVCALGGRHSSFSLTDQLVVTDKHEIPN